MATTGVPILEQETPYVFIMEQAAPLQLELPDHKATFAAALMMSNRLKKFPSLKGNHL
jgi:hypothetical protein